MGTLVSVTFTRRTQLYSTVLSTFCISSKQAHSTSRISLPTYLVSAAQKPHRSFPIGTLRHHKTLSMAVIDRPVKPQSTAKPATASDAPNYEASPSLPAELLQQNLQRSRPTDPQEFSPCLQKIQLCCRGLGLANHWGSRMNMPAKLVVTPARGLLLGDVGSRALTGG